MLAALLLLVATPKVEADVVYARPEGTEVKMDLYIPEKAVRTPVPVVLVIHGGAWISGSKADVKAVGMELANRGYLAAAVQYRLAPKYKWPAMEDDVQTAVRYLRANKDKYGLDPNRVAALGFSAGGHLALLLGTRETRDPKPADYPGVSSKVNVVVDFFGPTDLTSETDYPKVFDSVFATVLGKPRSESLEVLKDGSPLSHVTKDDAPTFIYQGLIDPLVNPNQSRKLEAKLKEVGVPVQSFYLEGVGHEVPMTKAGVPEAVNSGYEWLKKYLG
ncbi:MAG: alpha/beta hydrolase [Fimbriimonadales bacterium]